MATNRNRTVLRPRSYRETEIERIFGNIKLIGGILVSVTVTGISTTVWLTKNVATSSEIESGIETLRKYVDQKDNEILTKAYDHSDTNRRETLLKIEQMAGDVKSLSVKQDLMLDTLRSMQTSQNITQSTSAAVAAGAGNTKKR